jgi:uncharacterized membrane protein
MLHKEKNSNASPKWTLQIGEGFYEDFEEILLCMKTSAASSIDFQLVLTCIAPVATEAIIIELTLGIHILLEKTNLTMLSPLEADLEAATRALSSTQQELEQERSKRDVSFTLSCG